MLINKFAFEKTYTTLVRVMNWGGPCHNKNLTRPVLVILSALVVYPVVALIVLHTPIIHKNEYRHRLYFKYGLTINKFGGIISEY